MKKYEKVLLTVFGSCAVLAISFLLYSWLELEKGLGEIDDETMVLPLWGAFLSLFGVLAVLVSWRLRKRAEAGEKPISKLYKASFILSFVPFVWLVIYSFYGMADGFTFMSSTTYGEEAFYEYFVWYGVIIFGALIPVFPFLVFWQILYIIKRIQYRKLMRARS
ncbi:hypothetical protein [Ruminococcus flavefaciens]|uniref:hypothetical protein n=1 Tax=Ruminococcus flavefaciens TaxID=1265 RepID=UPI0026F328BE|nr:hypothetical protein [Ruminococcus flavefaciens]